MRVRHDYDALERQMWDISTHAPMRVRPSAVNSIRGLCSFQLTHPCGCDGKNREIFLILSVLIGYIIQHNPLFFKYFFLFISNFMFLIQIPGANLPRISCSLGVRTYLTIALTGKPLSICYTPYYNSIILLRCIMALLTIR